MSNLSDRMLAAGWVLRRMDQDPWSFVSPSGFCATLSGGAWVPDPDVVERELIATETAISTGAHTPFLGTSRLASPPLEGHPTLLSEKIALGGHARGHAVLRLLATPDPAGNDLLTSKGAWRVETLLPPWVPEHHAGPPPFHLLLCEHVLDTLPRADRANILSRLPGQLHPDGCIWFSFFQMSGMPPPETRAPHEDGYVVRYGRHRVFLRPYTSATATRELESLPRGEIHTAWTQHHELVCTWRPHA